MIQKFLKAKHWQLFILLFAIPMIFQFIFMGSMFSFIFNEEIPESDFLLNFSGVAGLLVVFSLIVYLCWFWSLGIGINNLLPNDLKQKTTKFKFALIYPVAYFLVFVVFIGLMFVSLTSVSFVLLSGVILPLHLLAMACAFYTLYFVAKAFKTVELQKEVNFGDFVAEFFLFWFFPIGVWFLQPKINDMVNRGSEHESVEIV